jgi:glycosyltransferase involved in cell wall biosynthesis
MPKMELSFVVIGLNEGKNIERTIRSINNLYLKPNNFEIIYIDSGSTDNTLILLEQFPEVNIYNLTSNKYSAALSRYVGSNIAKGEFIFFLDGDMEITANSNILFCLNELKKSKVGVISGKLPEIWYRNNEIYKKIEDRYKVTQIVEDLVSPGGFFIINKELLKRVGNFNINLKCNEEIELFSRIKKENFTIKRSTKLGCVHHYYLDNQSKTFYNKLTRGFFSDYWRALFNTCENKTLKYYLKFPGKKRGLIALGANLFMYLIILFSLVGSLIYLVIPIAYYLLLLVSKKFDIKKFIFNQKNNLFLILGFFHFIVTFRKTKVIYKIDNFEK